MYIKRMDKTLKNKIFDNWIAAIIILPINVLLIIPCILLYLTNFSFKQPSILQIIFCFISFVIGTFFAGWSMLTFKSKGNGTPAPWSPPPNFVVSGPYRYVRNPMISGVFFLLLSEVYITKSLAIFLWFVFFVFINLFYIRFVEEPALKKRFGAPYEKYLKDVPCWIPKISL